MVTPDGELLDVSDFGACLKSKLSDSSVVIKTSHSSEVFNWNAWSVVLADHCVCVGWVTYDDGLSGTLGVVVDSFTSGDEDLSVVFEEVGTFHTWSARLGTDEEVEINILEGNCKVACDDYVVEKGESTVVEFGLDTLKCVFSMGEIKQVKDNTLVGSEERATIRQN